VPAPPSLSGWRLHGRKSGTFTLANNKITFQESVGSNQFEGPIADLKMECKARGANCILTLSNSTSGPREQISIDSLVAIQVEQRLRMENENKTARQFPFWANRRPFTKTWVELVPSNRSGVYVIFMVNKKPLYIGQSLDDIRGRLLHHL